MWIGYGTLLKEGHMTWTGNNGYFQCSYNKTLKKSFCIKTLNFILFYWLVFAKNCFKTNFIILYKIFVLLPTNISTMFLLLLKYCPTIIVEVSLINPTPIPRRIFFLYHIWWKNSQRTRTEGKHFHRRAGQWWILYIGGAISFSSEEK